MMPEVDIACAGHGGCFGNVSQIEALENDSEKIPGMKNFNLPDNLLAYTRLKVANEIENRTPTSTRIITNILDSLRRNNKS